MGHSELTKFGHAAVDFSSSFATFSNGRRDTDRPLNQNLITFGDTLSWTLGKHNLKMGADVVRNQAVDGFAVNRGNVCGLTYAIPSACANALQSQQGNADWLLGLPPSSVRYVNQPPHPWMSTTGSRAISSRMIGKSHPDIPSILACSYELITPIIEKHDLGANFDPNFVDSTTGQLGRFVIPSTKTLQYLDLIIAFGVVTADKSGLDVGRGVVRTDKNNFAPRVGLAFRLSNKSIVRGGYGFYCPTSAPGNSRSDRDQSVQSDQAG